MAAEISRINISPLYGNDRDAKLQVAQEIDAVCRKSGFFQITHHEIKTD